MTYESLGADKLLEQGNSIIDFKTTEEKEFIEIIEQEIRDASNEYLKIRDSILGFKREASSTQPRSTQPSSTQRRKVDSSRIRESKRELIQNALEIVCERLEAQTAAVFLFSKRGVLERAGLCGFDRDGQRLSDNWFKEESYEVGESFTGMAAGSKYGRIQYTDNLSSHKLKVKNREGYISKLGSLNDAIAIPLNGRNKTYGVLRVLNKVETDGTGKVIPSRASFTKDDVKLLLFLANYIANMLSNFRRDIQTDIFKYLSRLLIQHPYNVEISAKALYQEIVDLLVKNPETAFNAGILRSKDRKTSKLSVEAVSLIDGIDDNRNDSPRVLTNDHFLGFVDKSKQSLILRNIQDEQTLQKFTNRDWIKRNKFKSFGCFPLISKDEVVGTFSLYTGYNYDFHVDSIDFLQGISDLIAAFMLELKAGSLYESLIKELNGSLDVATGMNKPKPSGEEIISSRFCALAEQWKAETIRIPSINRKMMHPAYQQIIGLGEAAIPFILEDLDKQPEHWFWALRAITGDNPVEEKYQGNIGIMTEAWLNWGREKGYTR